MNEIGIAAFIGAAVLLIVVDVFVSLERTKHQEETDHALVITQSLQIEELNEKLKNKNVQCQDCKYCDRLGTYLEEFYVCNENREFRRKVDPDGFCWKAVRRERREEGGTNA